VSPFRDALITAGTVPCPNCTPMGWRKPSPNGIHDVVAAVDQSRFVRRYTGHVRTQGTPRPCDIGRLSTKPQGIHPSKGITVIVRNISVVVLHFDRARRNRIDANALWREFDRHTLVKATWAPLVPA